MIVGIISDTHGSFPPWASDALEGCDALLCAGDVESPQILWELEGIAPTTAVRGNCDHFPGAENLPALVSPKFEGVRFRMTHRPQDIGAVPCDVKVVVHGHTHVPRHEMRGDVLFVNPGSPTYPRGNSSPSVAVAEVEEGSVLSLRFITG